jgi:hypothetical protein
VAYQRDAADLAAVYYAASLTPNPMLDSAADPASLAAYAKLGRRLADHVQAPPTKVIRCRNCGTREARPGVAAHSLAELHSRELLALFESRGGLSDGVRMDRHLLVHIPLAKQQGFDSVRVLCECGALHDLGFGWLARAPGAEPSTPIALFPPYPPETPVGKVEFPPRSPNDVERVAFARTAGPLDSPHLQIALTPIPYAFDYEHHFGFHPPHDDHLLRLIGEGNPHLEVFELRDKIIPQWRRWQLDPEQKKLDGWDEAIPSEAIPEIAHLLAQEDPDEREDLRLLFREVLYPDDFDTLQRLITEESK